jgi:hypothetical protein
MLPETIGPDAGKSFANEGTVATARITTLKNFLGITKLINSFSALAMPKNCSGLETQVQISEIDENSSRVSEQFML